MKHTDNFVPPPNLNGVPPPAVAQKPSGCGRGVGIGCLTIVFLMLGYSLYETYSPSARKRRESAVISSPERTSSTAARQSTEPIIWAEQLAAEYDANEIAADGKYKNEKVTVRGQVESVTRDALDSPVVLLRTTSMRGVAGEFRSGDEDRLAVLREGQMVTMQCRCDGLFGNVNLSRCELVE